MSRGLLVLRHEGSLSLGGAAVPDERRLAHLVRCAEVRYTSPGGELVDGL
jgi:hypothetical protein